MAAEQSGYRVLITSSSTASFAEDSPEQSEYALLETYLGQERPDCDWHCSAQIIYLTASMPERTVASAKRHEADVVVLRLVGGFFFNEYVIERIRRISPRLYHASRNVAQWWRDLAGGGPHGDEDARGWLYRFPRWLLIKTIGTAPRISVEDAIVAVTKTIDELLKLEDVHVLVRLPSYPKTRDTNLKEYERRTTAFGTAIREHCERRRVPYYDWAGVRRRAQHERVIGDDRWHPTLDSRDLDVRTMAQAVVAAVGGPLTEMYLQPDVEIQSHEPAV